MPSIPIDGTRPAPRPRAPGPVASPMPSSTGPRPTVRPRKSGGGSGPFIPQGPVFRGRGGRDFNVGDDLFNSIPSNQRALAQRTFRTQGIGGLTDRFAAEPWSGQLVSALRGAQQNGPGSRPVAGEDPTPGGGPAAGGTGAVLPGTAQQDTNPQPVATAGAEPQPTGPPAGPMTNTPPINPGPPGETAQSWQPGNAQWVADVESRLGAGSVAAAQGEIDQLIKGLGLPPGPDPQGRKRAIVLDVLRRRGFSQGATQSGQDQPPQPAPTPGQDVPGGPPVTYSPPINPGPIGVPNGLPPAPGPAYVPPVLDQDPVGVPNQPLPDIFGTYF